MLVVGHASISGSQPFLLTAIDTGRGSQKTVISHCRGIYLPPSFLRTQKKIFQLQKLQICNDPRTTFIPGHALRNLSLAHYSCRGRLDDAPQRKDK